MYQQTRRLVLFMICLVYFTIGATQSSSAVAQQSTMGAMPAHYYPFFPKTDGQGLQGVLHVQNAGTTDAFFHVDFYTEQGTLIKRYSGAIPVGAAQTVTAQALTDLPAGIYALQVSAEQPVSALVRVKATNRPVPGLAFTPGITASAFATSFYGGPIQGGAKPATVHLFNPSTTPTSGEIVLSTFDGTRLPALAWSLPANGHTHIVLNQPAADFVGTVQITAALPVAAILQQTQVTDGLALSRFNTPATTHHLPRVLKAAAEGDGSYTTKLLISNPTLNTATVDLSLHAESGEQLATTRLALAPNHATTINLDNLAVANGTYAAVIQSTAAVVVNEITDALTATATAHATYPGQLWPIPDSENYQLALPRIVFTPHGYSVLHLKNTTSSGIMVEINIKQGDRAFTVMLRTLGGGGSGHWIFDPSIFSGGEALADPVTDPIVIYASGHLVAWVDEYVLDAGEQDPTGPPPPVARFAANVTKGGMPLTVQFTNQTFGDYTSSLWSFGDGQSSTATAPTHTYTQLGDYTVTLTVNGAGGSHTKSQKDYIQVNVPQPPIADFAVARQSGLAPLTVQFANTTTGDYTSSHWDFGDGQSSTESSPIHTYAITGTYTVKLTATGPGGTNTITKADLIKVHSFSPIHPDGWDLTFGDYGYIDTQCVQSGPVYNLALMQRQSNGKIVVLLGCDNFNELILARYEVDGSIDLNFGTVGRIYLPYTQASALLVQDDGKIMIVHGLKVSRFLADGTLDQTFGSLGVADLFPDADQQSYFSRSLLQPDGKLIAVGRKNNQPIIARYTATGALDTSFNNTGYLLETISIPATNDDAANRWDGLLLLLNDKLLVSRKNITVTDPFTGATHRSFLLKRFNNNGSPDLTFGTGGIVEFDIYFAPQLATPQLALADGKVLFADGSIMRLTYKGALDSTFTAISGHDVKSDSSTRLYVTNYDGIRRYSLDGIQDPSFGKQGIIETPNSRLRTQLLLEPRGDLLLMQLKQELVDTNKYKVVLLRYIDDHPLPPPPNKPLTLLYAVLDNNLGDGWTRLVNNIEAGVRSGMTVRLLIDGPTDNDVYLYDVQPDTNPFCPSPANPTCNGRYAEGLNFWRVANENSAHPSSLYQFLVDAMNAYPTADKINLALIGHGSGWSANVLPGQPSIWRDQNDTAGGMLWDDHPAVGQPDSRSLSTKALGQALTWAGEETGKQIDLLYLDGCSMGMAEVAYEVRNGARYLLASPNIDWASFNYSTLLPATADHTGRALGERWLEIEAAEFRANPGHPFTLSLLDLRQMTAVATAASTLADSLRALLPAQQAQVLAAFTATDRFDSDYDGDLDALDAYSDLPDFVNQLSQALPDAGAVQAAAQGLHRALTAAVLAKDSANGSPWLFNDQSWNWRNYGGLGIYLPLGQDETRRQLFYHANNLGWTADTTWDEFLTAFWAGNSHAATTLTEMPVCHATTQGCVGLANPLPVQPLRRLFLPVVLRAK